MTNQKTSAFFNPRLVLAFLLCSLGVMMALSAWVLSRILNTKTMPSRPALTDTPIEKREQFSAADNQGGFVYLIEFSEPGLLRRSEHVSGQPFTANSAETQSQREQLATEQTAHRQAIDGAIGRRLNVTHYFQWTHSGLAGRLTPSEAEIVRSLPGIASIERERLYNLDT